MSRILNFNKFSKLYEAEVEGQTVAKEDQPVVLDADAQNLLDMIINLVSSCYGALNNLIPAGEYKESLQDLTSVISAASDKKGEAMKKIIAKVGALVSKEFKEAGLEKLWVEAGNLTADSYTALVDQFKDNKDKSEAANSMVNKRFTKFIEQLKTSKAEHQTQTNESQNFSSINEAWFTGKRGNVNNLIKQGIVIDSLLKQEASNKQLAPDVQKLQSELDTMLAKLAKLSKSKDARKEIEESELDKMAERLTQMPFDLNKKKEEMARSNKSFSEAASLYIKALAMASKAKDKEIQVKTDLSKTAQTGEKKTDGKSIPIKLEATISYDKANSGKVNPEVMKVQQLMYDKFKNDEKVSGTALFKKFASFFKDGKPDGKFGPSTAGLIRALRAGFELEKNSNISQKFIDELTAHEMVKESYSDKYLAPFMLEAFDYEAFSKELGSASSSGNEPGSKSGVKPVKNWGWESEDRKENWISDEDDRNKYKGKTLQIDSKKLDKDIKNFQTLALNYIKKIGGKDKVKDLLPQDFEAGNDKDRFNKFLDGNPDGLFDLNTMAAVRFIRALLHQKIQKDPDFLGKVKEFGLGSNGFIHNNTDNQRAYNINWPLANALEKALS